MIGQSLHVERNDHPPLHRAGVWSCFQRQRRVWCEHLAPPPPQPALPKTWRLKSLIVVDGHWLWRCKRHWLMTGTPSKACVSSLHSDQPCTFFSRNFSLALLAPCRVVSRRFLFVCLFLSFDQGCGGCYVSGRVVSHGRLGVQPARARSHAAQPQEAAYRMTQEGGEGIGVPLRTPFFNHTRKRKCTTRPRSLTCFFCFCFCSPASFSSETGVVTANKNYRSCGGVR